MSIYTKKGDNGVTSLMNTSNVLKSDDRIQLLGNIDELTSNLGLIKASYPRVDIRKNIEQVQKNLMTIMAGIADQYNRDYKLNENEIVELEKEIDRLGALFPELKGFVLPGGNKLSAQIDVARTVARRAERWMSLVAKKHTVDSIARRYLNRLSDYLYMVARYTDYLYENKLLNDSEINRDNRSFRVNEAFSSQIDKQEYDKPMDQSNNSNIVKAGMSKDDIVNAVVSQLAMGNNKISLASAKKLIDKIEEYSKSLGLNTVISVCGPEGNPIAVHAMDGAFLASFDIAMKKAYTSVALKMSTKNLSELAAPGGPLYGIDKADNGRIIIFGGGVPLENNGKIIGGLGISGGSAEEDSQIAEYGLKVLKEVL